MDEFEENTEKSLLKQSGDYEEVGDTNEVVNNDAGVHVEEDGKPVEEAPAADDADEAPAVEEAAPEADADGGEEKEA